MIPSHHPRPASLSRHCDVNPAIVTPLVSHPYKCPFRKPFPLTSLQMPGGYTPTLPILGIVHISQRPNDHFFSALFSRAYALFQVTYPVSPLLATLTKTAGCIPTIPILEFRACSDPLGRAVSAMETRRLASFPHCALLLRTP